MERPCTPWPLPQIRQCNFTHLLRIKIKTYVELKTTSPHAFGVSVTVSGINWSLHDTNENDDPEINQ